MHHLSITMQEQQTVTITGIQISETVGYYATVRVVCTICIYLSIVIDLLEPLPHAFTKLIFILIT